MLRSSKLFVEAEHAMRHGVVLALSNTPLGRVPYHIIEAPAALKNLPVLNVGAPIILWQTSVVPGHAEIRDSDL